MATAFDVSRKEIYDCSVRDSIPKVADILQKKNISSVLVKNAKEKHVGIITVGDLLRLIREECDGNKCHISGTAGDIMSRLDVVTPKDTSLEDLQKIFRKRGITRIPLEDENGMIVGIVRNRDVELMLQYEMAKDYLKSQRHTRF